MTWLALAWIAVSPGAEGTTLSSVAYRSTPIVLELAPPSACPASGVPRLTPRGVEALARQDRPLIERVRDALSDADLKGQMLDIGPLSWGAVRVTAVRAYDDACEIVPFTSILDDRPRVPPGVRTIGEVLAWINRSWRQRGIAADVQWWVSTPSSLRACVEVERFDDVRTLLARIGDAVARNRHALTWQLASIELGEIERRVLLRHVEAPVSSTLPVPRTSSCARAVRRSKHRLSPEHPWMRPFRE